MRPLDQIGRYSSPSKVARDALGAPAIEFALVLGEAPGVALVVEHAGLHQLGHRIIDHQRPDVLALEKPAQLGHRALAVADGPVGQLDRSPVLDLLAQAACSSGAGATGASGAGASPSGASTGATATGGAGSTSSAS